LRADTLLLTSTTIPVKGLREIGDKPLSGYLNRRRTLPKAQENQLESLLITLLAGKPNRKVAKQRPPGRFRCNGRVETVSAGRPGR
jgi:hypothetical protein